MLGRLRRDTVVCGLVLAAGAALVWPAHPGRAAGILGGLALVALSYAGIRAGVDAALTAATGAGSTGDATATPSRPAPPAGFVKFFTRHAMLAVGAYVMIARFELHPVAMLAGVTTPAVAAGIEFVRIVRARRSGSVQATKSS
ncbi:MAG: hypothetical protein AB7U83_24890 [Vicinamibacterales bacterium]